MATDRRRRLTRKRRQEINHQARRISALARTNGQTVDQVQDELLQSFPGELAPGEARMYAEGWNVSFTREGLQALAGEDGLDAGGLQDADVIRWLRNEVRPERGTLERLCRLFRCQQANLGWMPSAIEVSIDHTETEERAAGQEMPEEGREPARLGLPEIGQEISRRGVADLLPADSQMGPGLPGDNNIGMPLVIAHAERVYVGRAPQLPALHQLPSDLPDFADRDSELARLLTLLEPRTGAGARPMKVCVITGKPGAGKSAFAVRAAHRLKHHFPDAQLYADLRGSQPVPEEPGAILTTFLTGLGVSAEVLPSELGPCAALYRSLLSDKRSLLVLDDASDERQLRPLLPGGSRSAVLITSRLRLTALAGAELFELTDLPVDSALALLGQLVGPERIRQELEYAQRIVRLCGGLPLALRVAGAVLKERKHWTVSRLAERLADERGRLDLLRVGDLDTRAGFELSYRNLKPPAARIFRLLSVLPAADFSVTAVASMLNDDVGEAEDALGQLRLAQLLDLTESGRWQLHELVRIFSAERLRAEETPAKQRDALKRGLLWYADMAQRAASRIPGHAQNPQADDAIPFAGERSNESALDWFEAEHGSLVQAVAKAHEAEMWDVAMGIADATGAYLLSHGFWSDGQRVEEVALQSARRSGDRHREGRMLCSLGTAFAQQGKWSEATAHYHRGRQLLHELDDLDHEGEALVGEGAVYLHQGRWEEALRCLRQSLAISRETGARPREGEALVGLGGIYWYQGKWADAIACYEESLAIFRSLGDSNREGEALNGLGSVYREQGQRDKAVACHEESLAIFRRLVDRFHEAVALQALGNVRRDQGRWPEARACCEQSLAIRRNLGNRPGEGWSLTQLGHLYRDQGLAQESLTWYDQGLRIFEELGYLDAEGWTLAGMGAAHLECGDAKQALLCGERGVAVFRRLGDRQGEARALPTLGMAHLRLGHPDEALTCCQQGLAVSRELGDGQGEGETLSSLGHAYSEIGQWGEARASFEQSIAVFDRIGDDRRSAGVRASLQAIPAAARHGQAGDEPTRSDRAVS